MGFTQPACRRWKGKWGGGEIGRSSPHSRSARIPPLPLFPFEACHTGHVIKSGEMRGYRSLPHVNIARSTGSRTRNCSNKNPAGKIKIPLSRNNSHIRSLHRRLMLACAVRKVEKPVVSWNVKYDLLRTSSLQHFFFLNLFSCLRKFV